MTSYRAVSVGKRLVDHFLLAGLDFQHWGIKVGTLWYEIANGKDPKTGAATLMVIRVNEVPVIPFTQLFHMGSYPVDNTSMIDIMNEFVKSHPVYHLTEANCQYWVYYVCINIGVQTRRLSLVLPQTPVPTEQRKKVKFT